MYFFEIDSVKLSCSKVVASNIGTLRKAGDSQRSKSGKGVAIVGSVIHLQRCISNYVY